MSTKTNHLCVLVHGLWGNPEHLKFLQNSLRDKCAEDPLHILLVKSNAGSFTYDGVDTGGERVANEILQSIEGFARDGTDIQKISVIGYSLGGVVARYAIGLLYSKGVFERIEPVNFTTFATPHLGVRTPHRGRINHLWNVLGARTLSVSGRQLFMIDSFRETGRPLFSVLADTDSIFMKGLAQFKHRSLYANIVNDRTVTYYTSGISQTDPFARLDDVKINYLEGYEGVVIDARTPVSSKEPVALPAFHQRLTSGTATVFQRAPIVAFLLVFIPIGTTLFLVNSAIQSVRSRQRIRLHEEGKGGVKIGDYRIPLMINNARKEVEDMFENMANTQPQEYLEPGSEELASPTQPRSPRLQSHTSFTKHTETTVSDADSIVEKTPTSPQLEFPTLALTPLQFKMIENLDNVGFHKFPVHIQKHRHSHAAIIRRMDKKGFEEGHVVAKHWLDHFEI